MKKLLPVLLVLLLLMAAVPALAGGPTGGLRPLPLPTLVSRDLSFSIAGPSSGITGVEYTWYVRDTSEKTGRTYEYSIGKDDHSYPDENVTDTQYTVKQSTEYRFHPGR